MSRLFFLFSIFLTTGTTLTHAQSPYNFDWKKEGAIVSLGLSTWGTSYLLGKQTTVYNSDQLLDLSRARVNSFDRIATYNYSASAQKASDFLSMGSKMLPLTLLLGKNSRSDFGTIAALYAETFLVANGLTTLSKTAVHRTRPYVYNEEVGIDEKQSKNARYSFMSGHTSKTAAMTFFTAKVYSDYYPDSKWKPVVWAAAATVPAVTGYFRVKGGKHYPTDVIAGYAVGALSGILVPHLHKTKFIKNENLHLSMGIGGAEMTWVF